MRAVIAYCRAVSTPSEVSPGYLANNAPRLVSFSLFALFNVGLFLYAADLYAGSGWLVQTARGCGALVNFNAAFCLLPMMRLFISKIRRHRVSRFLALEDSIDFHRASGHTMFAAAILHTAVYVVIYVRSDRSLLDNLTGSTAALTGLVLVGLFVVLWVFAL